MIADNSEFSCAWSHSPALTVSARIRVTNWLLVFFVLGMPASAQSLDYGAFEHLFKGPVTTSATGSPQRTVDVPVNMIIVTADEIRRSGARDIVGALSHVAGIDVLHWGNDNSDLSIRGYNTAFASRTLVLIDGRQVYSDYYGSIPWSTLPVDLRAIRQIEVVKGVNSALFGFNAAGGVINIITYNPLYDDVLSFESRAGTQGLASVSGIGTLRLGSAGAVRVSADYRNDNDFGSGVSGQTSRTEHSRNHRFAADVKAAYAFDSVVVEVEGSHSQVAQSEVSPNYTLDTARYQTNAVYGRMSADTAIGLSQLSAYSNWTARKVSPSPDLQALTMKDQVTVVEAGNLVNLGADHTLRIAASYRQNTASTAPLGGRGVGYSVYSGSLMWSWQILPELSLTNAARLDRLLVQRGGSGAPVSTVTSPNLNPALDEWSFNSALVWSATPVDSFRLIAGRGLQLPNLVDFGAPTPTTPTPPLPSSAPQPLAPTAITNFELVWDHKFPQLATTLQLSVFHQNTSDVVSAIGDVMGTAPSAHIPMNIGSSMANGLEVIATGRLASHWMWSTSYRFLKIKDSFIPAATEGMGRVDFQNTSPKHVVMASLGWACEDWEATAYLHYQSEMSGLGFGASGTPSIKGYASVDARIAYRLADWATLSVSGANLLQERQRQTSGPDVQREVFVSLSLHG